MRKTSIATSFFLVLTCFGALSGCKQSEAKIALPEATTSEARLGVRVVSPTTKLDAQLVRATGRISARNEAQVSAKVSGSIAKLLVDVGDKVKANQPLALIDSTNAAIAVEQAEAARSLAQVNLETAQLEYERAQKLHASGGIPQATFDRAEAGFKQAQAALKQANAGLQAARKMLADHTLRAPFDGEVTAKLKNVGEYVAMMPPTPVFMVVDTQKLEVVLPVPETVIDTVTEGSVVRGVVNPSNKPFEAKVRVVGSVIDPRSRTVEVRADLEGALDKEMRPHAIVEVSFGQDNPLGGLFLPAQAVGRDDEGRFVWFLENEAVQRRGVEVESLSPGVVRIVSGLKEGDQVVADASSKLTNGMQVQVLR